MASRTALKYLMKQRCNNSSAGLLSEDSSPSSTGSELLFNSQSSFQKSISSFAPRTATARLTKLKSKTSQFSRPQRESKELKTPF